MENQEQNIIDNTMNDDNYLEHYGMPRRSGRYPWGSGDNPYQHSSDWLARYEELKKSGLSEVEIANAMDTTTTSLRAAHTLAINERRRDLVAKCKSLQKDGLSNPQIADRLGLKGESTVRSLLNASAETRMNICQKTADNLRAIVDEKKMIDIGKGVERELGISTEKFNTAVEMLRMEGYEVWGGRVPQLTNPGKFTTIKVLASPGTPHKDIFNFEEVKTLKDYEKISYDNGESFRKAFEYPATMDSKRLNIRYAEDGGIDKDGLIEIRRGKEDLYLGAGVNYAQVRILVGDDPKKGTHYIKGMAVYGDDKDFPPGVDVIFNTNKTKDKTKLEVLKSIDKNIKKDPENPFGSAIKERGGQYYYDDPNGNFEDPVTGKKQSLGLINKRATEGDWSQWADTLPSQFLGKQPLKLINKQLKISMDERDSEFKEITELTNPTLKKSLLETFAEDCDSAAVQLKAASLPGQKYQVILPLTSIGDKEIYAPNFADGSKLALIRYPHAGLFEIPILTVNNRNEEGIKYMSKNPTDAVGINSKVAERLSGADFDGDTVMVIPLSDKVQISSANRLPGLIGFDPKTSYGADPHSQSVENGVEYATSGGHKFKRMTNTQTQMGVISNLITDMTLRGAPLEDIEKAVKHSMVVIDAQKHFLDYKQSEIDNDIARLKKTWQKKENGKSGGASTLLSSAKSQKIINERKPGAFFLKDTDIQVKLIDEENDIYMNPKSGEVFNKRDIRTLYVDPKTGEKLYHETGRKYAKATYTDSEGKKKTVSAIAKDGKYYRKDDDGSYVEVPTEQLKIKDATEKTTLMEITKDAHELSSGTAQEYYYAEYANHLKDLANKARLESFNTKGTAYSAEAYATYSEEVKSLREKYNLAMSNKPRERRAQLLANDKVKAITKDNPNIDKEDLKKIKNKELAAARARVGAHREPIMISDREWEAIQSGAVGGTLLKSLIPFCDSTRLRQLATPRNGGVTISETKVSRMKNLANNGYTTEQIASRLGVSSSTVLRYIKGDSN